MAQTPSHRPLTRSPVPTKQTCVEPGCAERAAFRTRSKPTWCPEHIESIQRLAGLRPVEEFTHPESYQLTECLTCFVRAHYRFSLVLEDLGNKRRTCRACRSRRWVEHMSNPPVCGNKPLTPVVAELEAETYGFDYLQPLSTPSLEGVSPHLLKCRVCGKIGVVDHGMFYLGCSCSRGREHDEGRWRP